MGNDQQKGLQRPPRSHDDNALPSTEPTVSDALKVHMTSSEFDKLLESMEKEGVIQYMAMPKSCCSFVQTVLDTIKLPNSSEMDKLIDALSTEVEEQEQAEMKNKEKYDPLLLVPKENQIPNISTTFRYIKQLGKGASCRVFQAQHVHNKKHYAIKELTANVSLNTTRFCDEVILLKKLMHPNILHFYDRYMDNECYYIATEYCSGGTMLQKIIAMKSFSEQKASDNIRTILSAINYIHSLNIVHRDLKSNNVVYDKEGANGILQIIDFGDSMIVDDKQLYTEFVGTIHYVPPEIIRARTGAELKKSDLWSVGIITYLLVCGRLPFNGDTKEDILRKIISTEKKKKYPVGIHLTKSCKDFIERLICDDINDRMSAAEALQHEWISGGAACSDNLSNEVLKSLKRYDYDNKLQNILVNAILSEIDVKDQNLLSRGLLEMNRNVSSLNSNAIVDHLLLYAPVKSTQRLDVEWKKKRISEVKRFHTSCTLNISAYELDHIDETDVNADGIRNLDWMADSDVNLDRMTDIEGNLIEELLNEIDADCEQEEKYHQIPDPGHIGPRLTRATTNDIMERRITVERFRKIMAKTKKKYDVEKIVDALDDGTGYIHLGDIAQYSRTIPETECIQ